LSPERPRSQFFLSSVPALCLRLSPAASYFIDILGRNFSRIGASLSLVYWPTSIIKGIIARICHFFVPLWDIFGYNFYGTAIGLNC